MAYFHLRKKPHIDTLLLMQRLTLNLDNGDWTAFSFSAIGQRLKQNQLNRFIDTIFNYTFTIAIGHKHELLDIQTKKY